jgi:hypothetical protein
VRIPGVSYNYRHFLETFPGLTNIKTFLGLNHSN